MHWYIVNESIPYHAGSQRAARIMAHGEKITVNSIRRANEHDREHPHFWMLWHSRL